MNSPRRATPASGTKTPYLDQGLHERGGVSMSCVSSNLGHELVSLLTFS